MIEPAFAFAAVVAAFGVGFHVLVGGRLVARSLLDSPGLAPPARWIAYFCWHMATLTVAAMAAGFAWAAVDARAALLGGLLTGLSLAFAGLCAWVAFRARLPALRLPPLLLFITLTAAGAWGLAG